MKIVNELLDKTKLLFKKIFIADESATARLKHIRFGVIIVFLFLALCLAIILSLNENKITPSAKPISDNSSFETEASAISDLAKGVSNEQSWIEIQGREVDQLKNKQFEIEDKQTQFEEKITKDKISRDEVASIILELRNELEGSYKAKLDDELSKIRQEQQKLVKESSHQLESKTIIKKKKVRKIGDYIPANSYVQAKLISGVDAGVGMSSEANPRQTLLRITGEVTSAGFGSDYLKTNRLMGCLLSAKAVGDISSEKAYLDGVLLTCAIDKTTAIEVPVKAYITSNAKSGIRGEVISREGDMVLRSFLAGLTSGFGSSISQMSQPQMALSGSNLVTSEQKLSNVLRGGLGSGAASSGNNLSEYFIKRAEQYQPVISVNEGIEVYVVFQEGFSLKEGDQDEKNS